MREFLYFFFNYYLLMSDIEIKNLEKLLDFDNNNKKYILDKFINNYFDKYNNEYKDSYIDVSNEIYKDTNILDELTKDYNNAQRIKLASELPGFYGTQDDREFMEGGIASLNVKKK